MEWGDRRLWAIISFSHFSVSSSLERSAAPPGLPLQIPQLLASHKTLPQHLHYPHSLFFSSLIYLCLNPAISLLLDGSSYSRLLGESFVHPLWLRPAQRNKVGLYLTCLCISHIDVHRSKWWHLAWSLFLGLVERGRNDETETTIQDNLIRSIIKYMDVSEV